jgi:hypothetical protein
VGVCGGGRAARVRAGAGGADVAVREGCVVRGCAAERERLPALSDKQEAKLRQLSFVSLAASRREVALAEVARALGLESARAAEEVVISSLNAGIVEGKINQRLAHVEVDGAMGRDVRREALGALGDKLGAWRGRVAEAIGALKAIEEVAKSSDEAARQQAAEVTRAHAAVVAAVAADDRARAASGANPAAPGSLGGGGGFLRPRLGGDDPYDDFHGTRHRSDMGYMRDKGGRSTGRRG